MQSQNTFSGKENEKVESWLTLLRANFDLNKIHLDDWIAVAATYLRDAPLRFFMSKKSSLNMSDWSCFVAYMMDNKEKAIHFISRLTPELKK